MAAAVERLVAAGVKLGQIGVICFFRAQVGGVDGHDAGSRELWEANSSPRVLPLKFSALFGVEQQSQVLDFLTTPPAPCPHHITHCGLGAQVALVRQVLERRLPQLQAQQQRRPQAAALAGDGSSESSEGEALGPPGSGGRGGLGSQAAAEDEEGSGGGSQEQQAVQVATVDSFQVCGCFRAAVYALVAARLWQSACV